MNARSVAARAAGLVCMWALPGLLGCGRTAPLPDQELRDTLGIGPKTTIHSVSLTRSGAADRAQPARVEAAQGDVVQFVTGDRLLHLIRFEGEGLTDGATRFLTRTGQLQSPPLLTLGTRFVVSFEGAPPGDYPFIAEGNGDSGHGVIVVAPAAF